MARQGNYNLAIQSAIRNHLWEKYKVSIPPFYSEYRKEKEVIFQHDAYGKDLENHLHELCNYHYLLGANKVFFAQFKDQNGFQIVNKRVGQYYSKHRLDPMWNSTKSKKFRAIMSNFLKEERWHEIYQPTHLVLTVPHKGGIWKGKQIYITELIKAFRALRHERWWKKYIAGGLYCVEVKKNQENGYHIHLHVLCFSYQKIYTSKWKEIKDPVNHVREKINKAWKNIVGNETTYNGAFYESLYFPMRDENGKLIITETASERSDWQFKKGIQKYYIKPGDSEELWIKGVMECLKYHFKPGVLEKTDRTFDVDLITEIVNNTKGDRFMSKFGELYNHKGLSLNKKKTVDDVDADCLGDALAMEESLEHPFTGEKCNPFDYTIFCADYHNILPTLDPGGGMPSIRLKSRSPVLLFELGTSVKEAFTEYCSGKFFKGIKGMMVEEIPREGKNSEWRKKVGSQWLRVEDVKPKFEEECPF